MYDHEPGGRTRPAEAPHEETGKVGVCVLAYHSRAVILSCLRSLRLALKSTPHQIVVVDNASLDGTAELLREEFPAVHMITNATNVGYASGNNIGARYLLDAGCQYLAFVNPDVTVREDTLRLMQLELSRHPRAGCIGGLAEVRGKPSKMNFRNKPGPLEMLLIYGHLRYLPGLRSLLRSTLERLEAHHFVPNDALSETKPVYAVAGACIMFPATVFEKIGGFDPGTFLYQEEYIVSERLRRIGYEVVGSSRIIYSHHHGHSVQRLGSRSLRLFVMSEQYLLKEYYHWGVWRYACLLFRCAEVVLFMLYYDLFRRVWRAVKAPFGSRRSGVRTRAAAVSGGEPAEPDSGTG